MKKCNTKSRLIAQLWVLIKDLGKGEMDFFILKPFLKKSGKLILSQVYFGQDANNNRLELIFETGVSGLECLDAYLVI